MAGSSEIISPFRSNLFQQLHDGHLKLRMLAGNGTGDWQKKHWTLLCRLNMFRRERQQSRGRTPMSLAPAPSASRGDVVLQPSYFTSSVYVKALRDDISTLILRYHEVHSQPQSLGHFALFKSIWLRMGWHWLQFKVFDHRSRQTFLDVTMRLFLGRLFFFCLKQPHSHFVS